MTKTILFNEEAKKKLKKGIDIVNQSVSVTLGPWGRNVLIEKEHGEVISTKDGVTVSKSIELEDPIENMAATIIRKAASKTVDQAGDGTTTSTVLAHAISTQALDVSSYASVNVNQVKMGIEFAVKQIVDELKKNSKPIKHEDEIKQIATLSANGDKEIGNLVSTALDKVGRDGVVAVEESKTGETSLEVVEGMQFDRGYKSHYFVTNNDNMSTVLTDAYILLYEKRISNAKDIVPILEKVSQEGKSLVIIAEDITDEALATLIVNKMRGTIKVAAVKAPDFGDRRTLILEDIAILTGGTLVSPDKGMKLDKFDTNWFGVARTITINKDTTTIVDGKGEDEDIEKRILELKSQIDKSTSPYETEKIQDRLSKIIGGVAIINVGGGNDIEIKEKKDRVEDSLAATKSALEEGIVIGCGRSLLNARRVLDVKGNTDFDKGIEIIHNACGKPFKKILENAGQDASEWWVKLSTSNENDVPDIEKGIVINAFENGIIDPLKVVRCALQNASTAALTFLLTECVIHDKKEDKKRELNMEDMGM